MVADCDSLSSYWSQKQVKKNPFMRVSSLRVVTVSGLSVVLGQGSEGMMRHQVDTQSSQPFLDSGDAPPSVL